MFYSRVGVRTVATPCFCTGISLTGVQFICTAKQLGRAKCVLSDLCVYATTRRRKVCLYCLLPRCGDFLADTNQLGYKCFLIRNYRKAIFWKITCLAFLSFNCPSQFLMFPKRSILDWILFSLAQLHVMVLNYSSEYIFIVQCVRWYYYYDY